MFRIVKNTILITILLGFMLLAYDYFTNERLNAQAKLKFTEMCKSFPTVEGDDLIQWKALKERVNNKNIEETKIVFDDQLDYRMMKYTRSVEDRVQKIITPIYVDGNLRININDVVLIEHEYFPTFFTMPYHTTSCFDYTNNEYENFLDLRYSN
jgi:hypothetical protein